MLRVFSAALVGLTLLTGVVLAADHRGYLKAVEGNQLTVTVMDKDKETDVVIKADAATKYFGGTVAITPADLGKMLKESPEMKLRVLVKTNGTGAAEVAAEVRVGARKSGAN